MQLDSTSEKLVHLVSAYLRISQTPESQREVEKLKRKRGLLVAPYTYNRPYASGVFAHEQNSNTQTKCQWRAVFENGRADSDTSFLVVTSALGRRVVGVPVLVVKSLCWRVMRGKNSTFRRHTTQDANETGERVLKTYSLSSGACFACPVDGRYSAFMGIEEMFEECYEITAPL